MTLLANAAVAMTITLVVILIGSSLFGLGSGRARTIQRLGPQRKRLALGVVLIQRDQWLRLRSQYAGEVLAPLVPKYVRMAILRARHLRPGPVWWILPWVMPALLAVCFAKNLDS